MKKVTIALILLGIFFRWLYWLFGRTEFHNLILLEGGLSGLGVAVGIMWTGRLIQEPGTRKWYHNLIPYACGGTTVFFGKLGVKVFGKLFNLSPKSGMNK